MKRPVAGVLVALSVVALGVVLSTARLSPQEAADFFAGNALSGPIDLVARIPAVKRARAATRERVAAIRQRTIPLAAWAAERRVPAVDAIFYPFSGPDISFPLALFPHARHYILVSTESPWPDDGADPLQVGNAVGVARRIPAMLAMPADDGYFLTAVMERAAGREAFPGILPLAMAAISGLGARALRIDRGCLNPGGEFQPDGSVCGFDLTFAMPDGAVHDLIYLQLPLEDASLGRHGELAATLARRSYGFYCKSGEYKLQDPGFSRLASLALAAAFLIQDDSCLPLRAFDATTWDLRFFGVYRAVLPGFERYFQSDLADAYHDPGAAPVPQIGGYNGHFNQLVATRKVSR